MCIIGCIIAELSFVFVDLTIVDYLKYIYQNKKTFEIRKLISESIRHILCAYPNCFTKFTSEAALFWSPESNVLEWYLQSRLAFNSNMNKNLIDLKPDNDQIFFLFIASNADANYYDINGLWLTDELVSSLL